MERVFLEYLFQKRILVSESGKENRDGEKNVFETLFSLLNLFQVSITEGREYAQTDMIRFCSEMFGRDVPKPFYVNFPQSVRELSTDELLFDQFAHYVVTYGFGHFEQAGHSLFEETMERLAFKEETQVREFVILKEEEAVTYLAECVDDLLRSTRPLNENQFQMLLAYLPAYAHPVRECASKNTAVRLMVGLRELQFSRFLVLSDVIKVLDEIQFTVYQSTDVKKLNLRNQDRKFLSRLMDDLFAGNRADLTNCYEKKDVWCGLLHHLHYQPKTQEAKNFVTCMRTKGNGSVYSAFESAMKAGNVREAVNVLMRGKGSGALLRNLDYVISRIETPEDLTYVLENLDTKNNLLLMQLLLHYSELLQGTASSGRRFMFTKHGVMMVHAETAQERSHRKSVLSRGQATVLVRFVKETLERNLKNKLGKVYLDEGMRKIALPLQESTAQGGFGVLAKGSRLSIPEGKKIRAFTYWEKVNDIDLSVIGMDNKGKQIEFSWRTMAEKQSDAITYSGDETSGYNGGSEYYDVDLEEFHKLYPDVKQLIFCNNVFSAINFEKCYCTAGYMMRDVLDSGEIFEPKTVQTSFRINCPSTFAYLFGIDIEKRELVWLNVSKSGQTIVAGETPLHFLLRYFYVTETLNVGNFFEMMAAELVSDPTEADVIVTDDQKIWEQANGGIDKENSVPADADAPERKEKTWIRSFDFEKLLALMNS